MGARLREERAASDGSVEAPKAAATPPASIEEQIRARRGTVADPRFLTMGGVVGDKQQTVAEGLQDVAGSGTGTRADILEENRPGDCAVGRPELRAMDAIVGGEQKPVPDYIVLK